MDEILHEDFVLVLGNGDVVPRDRLLAEARNESRRYDKQDEVPGSQTVRMFDDTAVVTAKLWLKGTGKGDRFDRKLWFSDTYVRTEPGWRYALGQASLDLPTERVGTNATKGAAAQDVEAVSRAFDDAQFRKDAVALDALLADDFRFVRRSSMCR